MALYYFHHQYSCGPKGRYYTVDDAGSELPGLYEARELAFELARKEATLESPAGNSRIVVTDRAGKTLLTIYSSDWIAPPRETQEVVPA